MAGIIEILDANFLAGRTIEHLGSRLTRHSNFIYEKILYTKAGCGHEIIYHLKFFMNLLYLTIFENLAWVGKLGESVSLLFFGNHGPLDRLCMHCTFLLDQLEICLRGENQLESVAAYTLRLKSMCGNEIHVCTEASAVLAQRFRARVRICTAC